MKELIERLEKATGPDRSIDLDIERDVRGAVPLHWRVGEGGVILSGFDDVGDSIPAYTASLDAALTLVPGDMDWLVGKSDSCPTASVQYPHFHPAWALASTPAIALCIAALRAREQGK